MAALFLMGVVLQRFAVPGLPTIALLVPAVLAWAVAAVVRGVVVVDSTRLTCWLVFASSTGFLMFVQTHVVASAEIGPRAWALLLMIWLPFTVRLVDGGAEAYMAMLRYVANICTGLGVASVAMIGIQVAGVSYRDWFALIVPEPLRVADFMTSYPIEYGSELYKSNAFIGLEPSMVSSLLGVGVLAGILAGARVWKLAVMLAGLVATLAGSGMMIVLIGFIAMLCSPRYRRTALSYLSVLAVAAAVGSLTTFGGVLYDRVGEFQASNSSTTLRVFDPYRVLFPMWTGDPAGALFGYGPGSSQRVIADTAVEGVLATTPIKIFFEYGVVGGLLVAGFVLLCYWGGPSRTLSASLLVSIWLLQAGLASVVIMLPVLVVVTLWSPRAGAPIEAALPSQHLLPIANARPPLAGSRL